MSGLGFLHSSCLMAAPDDQSADPEEAGQGEESVFWNRLPTVWETQVQFLGQESLLEKEMAIHSSILAWKIPWTEEPGRVQSMGVANSQT